MEGTLDKAQVRPTASATASPSGGAFLRLIKFAAALALLPLCVGMTRGTFEILQSAWSASGHNSRQWAEWFGGGGAAFVAAAVLLWRPVVVYVFGHELMHALATWMCLGSVKNFRASATGGSVVSSKTNTLIRLAPYCVPLYALLAAGVYLALDRWRPMNAHLHWVMAALGFFYAFHVGFTLWSLRRDQPDLKPDGWFFSLVVIYLANLAVFALLIGFVMTGHAASAWPALKAAAISGWHHGTGMYHEVANAAQKAAERVSR